MGEKRTWDESRSPQWRYLLSKDSKMKREKEKREERMERTQGELTKRVSKQKRANQERHKEKRKTKAGKEILYSASPGGENSRYHNKEFEKDHPQIRKPSTVTIDNMNRLAFENKKPLNDDSQ